MKRLICALVAAAGLLQAGASIASAGELTYLVHQPATPAAHSPLMILLHGSGADERDMVGLWRQLPSSFIVVSPRAPFADAGGGYRWYRRGTPAARDADIAISRKIIDVVVENAVRRFDADPKRVFLAGFSQGAVMVYEATLGEPGRFRGGAVLSGTLFSSELAALPPQTDRAAATPLFVGHGTADPRIPFASAEAARAALARLGVPVTFHAYPGMGHTIGDAEMDDLDRWLTPLMIAKSDR